MKNIIYTQRVEVIESYNERRDCADQNIPQFINACGYLPIPIPNIPNLIEKYFEKLNPDGIVLTGGNSLTKYGGNALEKDECDANIIQCAINKHIPIYGFCRGMQSLLDYFHIPLETVENHVAVQHELAGKLGKIVVNSYHNQGAYSKNIPEEIIVLAQTKDGVVEAIEHQALPILGTMWHPERDNPFKLQDIERVQRLFGE